MRHHDPPKLIRPRRLPARGQIVIDCADSRTGLAWHFLYHSRSCNQLSGISQFPRISVVASRTSTPPGSDAPEVSPKCRSSRQGLSGACGTERGNVRAHPFGAHRVPMRSGDASQPHQVIAVLLSVTFSSVRRFLS